MGYIEELKQKIYTGADITWDEVFTLVNATLEELTAAANEIREKCAETGLLCARSSMANAGGVWRIASTAPRRSPLRLRFLSCTLEKIFCVFGAVICETVY